MSFSVAVFPYLKTSGPVRVGPYQFRSTLDVEGLKDDQSSAVREIAEMLYVKDELRVISGSYSIVPPTDINGAGEELDSLFRLRAVVAYLYSQPHEVFDSIFLSPEECSLHVLTPARVSEFLVRPEHHTSAARQVRRAKPDRFHTVRGYEGLFNLSRAFWVEPRSRIDPPVPQITLNISQDLAGDLAHTGPTTRSLLRLLVDAQTGLSQRILTAVSWYNFANEELAGPDRALLNLAVAFEALLLLPEDAKSDRFVDAVGLLLGRTERIDVWARQFYDARSRVAHEGRARDLHLYPSELRQKQGSLDGRAAPLMFYGRQIFRLCLATILAGGDFVREAVNVTFLLGLSAHESGYGTSSMYASANNPFGATPGGDSTPGLTFSSYYGAWRWWGSRYGHYVQGVGTNVGLFMNGLRAANYNCESAVCGGDPGWAPGVLGSIAGVQARLPGWMKHPEC